MQNLIQHLKDLLGIANGLSAEQKHDLVKAGVHSMPAGTFGVGAAVAPTAPVEFFGIDINTWTLLISVGFIFLQAAFVIWRWRRQANIDAERRAAGLPLEPMEK